MLKVNDYADAVVEPNWKINVKVSSNKFGVYTASILLALSMCGCATRMPMASAPQDMTIGAGVAILDGPLASKGQESLIEALNIAGKDKDKSIEQATLAEKQYIEFLASPEPGLNATAATEYNIALCRFLRSDYGNALLAIEHSRALMPDAPHIIALNDRIVRANVQNSIGQFDNHLAQLNKTFEENAKLLRTEMKTEWDQFLVALSKQVPSSEASVVLKQTAAGQRALDLGNKTMDAGDAEKAMLYFVNGVNQCPSRMELVNGVADAAMKSGNKDMMERAIGILELATMQVAPDDVESVMDKITQLRSKTAPPATPRLSPDDAVNRITQIFKDYNPDLVWSDRSKLSAGLSEIESFSQAIEFSRKDENDASYDNSIKQAGELASALQAIQGTLPLYEHVKACSAQMNAIAESDSPDIARFSSISASAQGVLAQTWGGVERLPEGMRNDLNSIPTTMKNTEEKLQDKTSKSPYDAAVADLEKANADQNGNLTERINRITGAIEATSARFELITSSKMRLQLFKKMKETRECLMSLELSRRVAYQKWALGCVNGFMVAWNSEKVGTDEKATHFFEQNHIAQIDETIILPEVARVLGRVMTCMTGELNAKDGSEIERKMAAGIKKKMEDF